VLSAKTVEKQRTTVLSKEHRSRHFILTVLVAVVILESNMYSRIGKMFGKH
jgi:hypothetical protein